MKAKALFVLKILFPSSESHLRLSFNHIIAKPRASMNFLVLLLSNIQDFGLGFRGRRQETHAYIYKSRFYYVLNHVRLILLRAFTVHPALKFIKHNYTKQL